MNSPNPWPSSAELLMRWSITTGRLNILLIRWRYSICRVSNMQKAKPHNIIC
jgi:hypothetical protein